MRNHAILIETHSNVELLKRVIEYMKAENHYFFIHVDRKTKNYKEFLSLSSSHVFFTNRRYNVRWGAVEQIYLTIELLRMAFTFSVNFDYYHLISGQDYPIKNNTAFDAVFNSGNYSYMELCADTFFPSRYMYYHLNGIINVRGKWGRRLEKYSLSVQKKIEKIFPLRKKLQHPTYKGSNWWSLHKEAVNYILRYIDKNPSFLFRFRFTSCCDEIFFHTLLFNSDLRDTIVLDDLRYVDWSPRRKGEPLPRLLKEDDYERILNSEKIFCRKIGIPNSFKLLELLK